MRQAMRLCVLSMLVWCGLTVARPLYLLAQDPNCQEVVFGVPTWAEPNEVVGAPLPWVSGDPNGWHTPTGKGNRLGTWCDPEGQDVFIACETEGWTVTKDPNGLMGVWTLAGEVQPGPNYIYIRVADIPGPEYNQTIERFYTVIVFGDPIINHRPILASVRRLLYWVLDT